MTIGFVGAGRMGQPMVDRLVRGELEVSVFSRSAVDATSSAGAVRTVRNIAGVASDAQAVVVCVHTDEQVRSICLDDGLVASMRAGSVLVVHTTGSPFTVRDIELAAAQHGVEVVDAPVSGGPHDIAAGKITTFVGGRREAVDKARAVLGCYSDPILHVGGLGSGQLTKLVNNTIFASNVAVLNAAGQLGSKLGLDETTLIECLKLGSARSAALDSVARAGSSAGFVKSVGEFLVKDIAVVRDVATELGVELGMLESVLTDPVHIPIPETQEVP